MNTKIVFRNALQLGTYEFLTAVVLLLQTPVPNYQDVDLSFVYETKISTMNFAKEDLSSPYDYVKKYVSLMSKVAELQLSSPRIREFMRFA